MHHHKEIAAHSGHSTSANTDALIGMLRTVPLAVGGRGSRAKLSMVHTLSHVAPGASRLVL